MNQRYWTAGLEMALKNYQIQLATYGEEIGTATTHREDRRYVAKFAFRFLGDVGMKNFGILLVRLNLMIFISFVNLSCGSNVLQSVGSHSSDEAIMDDIESYQRKDQFDLAIAKFDELSVAKLAETATQVYKASVYADACGLQFITMLTSLSDLSSSKLFQVLENTMKGSTKAKIDYCIAAEEIMLTLDAAGKLGVESTYF